MTYYLMQKINTPSHYHNTVYMSRSRTSSSSLSTPSTISYSTITSPSPPLQPQSIHYSEGSMHQLIPVYGGQQENELLQEYMAASFLSSYNDNSSV